MELSDLVGLHILDAVDLSSEEVRTWGDEFEHAHVIRFRLDQVCYVAVEDPSDGYRSAMGEIHIEESPNMKNEFIGIDVFCRHKTDGSDGSSSDTIQCFDVKNGKLVLEVGTENTDDYYPSFIASFIPENMSINDK